MFKSVRHIQSLSIQLIALKPLGTSNNAMLVRKRVEFDSMDCDGIPLTVLQGYLR